MYDLEGSNNVDPLVSGYGQIYLTMKYICPLVFLSVLIFSKPTRACRGYPSSKHVCSTARLTARPHALRPCARLPRGCHFNSRGSVHWSGYDATALDSSWVLRVYGDLECVCVCVLLLQDLLQSCARGGRRRVEDMCYERRRAEACVDESAHQARL